MAKVELKQPIVQEISENIKDAQSVVVVDYRGLTVAEDTQLRKALREAGVTYKVYKNTLMNFAFKGTDFESLAPMLDGPNAIAISTTDATAPARILSKFAKTAPALEIKGGVVEGTFYDAEGMKAIAAVPSREELLSKLLGSMQSPITNFARVINQIAEQGGAGESVEAAPAEEAEEDAGWSLVDITKEAVGVVGENLAGLGGALLDPLGIEVGDLSDTAAAAEEQEVSVDSVSIMHQLFGTGFAAFCYLLMVLLYMPCGAAVAAVFREAGAVWTVFLACWTTIMGFSTSTIVYRLGTFSQDPMYAILSIVIAAVLLVGMVFWMRSYVKRARLNAPKVIPIAAQ